MYIFLYIFLVLGRTGNKDNGKSLGQGGALTKPFWPKSSVSSCKATLVLHLLSDNYFLHNVHFFVHFLYIIVYTISTH